MKTGPFNLDDKKSGIINKRFYSRADNWYRNYFSLAVVRKLLDKKFVKEWMGQTIKDIYVYTEKDRIQWSNIQAIKLVENENKTYGVQVKRRNIDGWLTVYNGNSEDKMIVKGIREVTVDHIIPLKFIVGEIAKWHPALKRILDNSDLIPSDFSKDETKDLENAMCAMRLNNDCVLMTQSQNSQKSNNINYIGAIKTGPCTFDYIMAKDLMCDGKEFYVHYTTGNESIPELVCGKAPECRYNYQDNNKTK